MSGTGRRVLKVECPETRAWLHRYVEGEVEPILARLIETHLGHCPSCRAIRSELEEERLGIIEAALNTPTFSDTFRRKVLDQLRHEKDRSWALRRRNLFFRLSGAAAVLFVLCLASLRTFQGSSAPEPALASGQAGWSTAGLLAARDAEAPVPEAAPAREPWARGPIESRSPDGEQRLETSRLAVRESREDPSSANADNGQLLWQVGEMISAAVHMGNPDIRVRPEYRDPPCRPDPNRDGKMDLNDVAYSCQILLTGGHPWGALGESESPLLDPECFDVCLKV